MKKLILLASFGLFFVASCGLPPPPRPPKPPKGMPRPPQPGQRPPTPPGHR